MAPGDVKERIGAALGGLAGFLVLGSVGAAAGWVIAATVGLAWDAERWVKVRADVDAWKEGEVSYTYEWNGRKYVGTRLGTFVPGGSSNVDDWEASIDDRLSAAVAQKKPISVFVDPANPAESLVDRQVRWKLLLVFVPFAVGFGGAAIVIGVTQARKALGFNRPLLTEPSRAALTQWAVAIGWNAITLPLSLIALPKLWDEGEWIPICIIGVLAALGLLMLVGALAATVRMIRAGNPFNLAVPR